MADLDGSAIKPPSPRPPRRTFAWSAMLLLPAPLFLAGLAIGYLQLPPVPQLLEAKRWIVSEATDRPAPLEEVHAQLFTGALVAELIHPPITTLAGIRAANDRIFTPVSAFGTAYEDLKVTGAARLSVGKSAVLRVSFGLAGKEHHAYAYIINSDWHAERRRTIASLVIPGTGTNMSSRMRQMVPGAGGATWLPAFNRSDTDLFLFIKPNEDALAFHNGRAKLDFVAVNNYHLNRGGSYAASYLVQSLAVTKYLQSLYSTTVVAGVSQGGQAALLNALQSRPDIAIVASGFTLTSDVEISDFQQIVIPGVWRDLSPRRLSAALRAAPTNFLFTWGKNDTPMYRYDVQQHSTCRALGKAPNLTCTSHLGGHDFPILQVQNFLTRQFQRATVETL